MRKGLSRLTVAVAVFASFTIVPAMEEKRNKSQDPPAAHPGIATVTDGNGNPLPLKPNAAESPNRSSLLQPQAIHRGQAWWPYGSSQPPYNAVGKRAEAMTANEIQVNGVALLDVRDVEATMRLMPRDLKLQEGAQLAQRDGYFLVKIEGFTRTQEQLDALEHAGAVLGEYININTYIAKIPSKSVKAVKALPFVTFVGDYHPAYKISPRIGLEEIPEDEAVDRASGKTKPWVFEVTLHSGADLNQALEGLRHQGISPERGDIVSNDGLTVVLVHTTPEAVLSIAQLPEVKWIAEKTYAHLMASNASPATIPMLLQNNGAFTTNTALGWKLFNAGIDGNASGTAQIVTMMDTGLNTNMEHFAESTAVAGTLGASHRKVVGDDVYGGDQCVNSFSVADGGHGTWTSQHAVGSISNMTANPDVTHVPNTFWDPGIARDAKVYFQDIGNSAGSINPPLDLGPSIVAAIGKGSFVQNHSWGAATPTYDTEASNLDAALFSNPNFVVTVSAGNRGTQGTSSIGNICTSKNVICVGGNDAASPNRSFQDCLWDGVATCGDANDLGSSRGPVTTSNRVKPDIMTYVAFSASVGGENEAGNRSTAMCQTDVTKTVYWDWVNTNLFGGTSFAAPEVAGLAALVRDYFLAGYYPSGTATPADSITPSGSLVKAVILASGEDMDTVSSPSALAMSERYSNDVGYGRANLPGVLRIGAPAPFLWVQNNDSLGQSATKTFFYSINGNGLPLRILLAWYDAAGNAIQKNANLRVTIGANVYLGNTLSGGWSTTGGVADATNNTEGVFLDAAHGLPASGTVQVEVIGFNNPGGMNYSLVVSGNVASAAVQQVSLDKGQYTCAGPINITVNDSLATSPVSVTLTSRNSVSTVIDTKIVSCAGAAGVFNGTILAGSGILVANGGTVTATYSTATPAVAAIACQASLDDEGFIISGGCDNAAAGTDTVTGPLFNGGVNEFYNKYMDAGEYNNYTVGFSNQTGSALNDVTVALSFSGVGASKMTALNGPIHLGYVAAGATAGAVFQVFTDPSATGLAFPASVSMNFSITSTLDGYTTPTLISQTQLLQANDTIARQNRCSTFNTSILPWVDSQVTLNGTAGVLHWHWSGTATAPATVSSENRTDGICSNSTANAAAMVGNSAITTGNNFPANADSMMLQNFQPALIGNAPNGQPYNYVWKWHSFYHTSETVNATTGVWGVFYNDQWNNPVNPSGDQVAGFPNNLAYYYQTIFDYVSSWNWETANTGTPDDPRLTPTTGGAPNQQIITFTGVSGLAAANTYFAYGHEHADLRVFGGASSATTRRDIAFDNDNLVYDEYFSSTQAAACTAGTQLGLVSFDQFNYQTCPTGTAVISVVDPDAGTGPVQVTVSSPGTGDIEILSLGLVGVSTFSGSITISTNSGVGNNNGILFALPNETLTVTYTDTSPVGSSTATASTACTGGDVAYVTNTQISDNGDNDGLPDNNECVTMDITIQNNLVTPLTNTKVTIFTDSPNIDLISDDHALYGTVNGATAATNPASDRFSFHVASTVACSDPANPPTAKFTVVITADGLDGPSVLQTFTLSLDLDIGGGTTSYSQNFTVNPGWTTAVTAPDNPGCGANTYTNDFHWCTNCGSGGGGNGAYGAWVGNAVFGTLGQNYTDAYNSSTLYSPVFTAGGASVTMQFREAGRFEFAGASLYDGGIVQYQLGAGAWTTLPYTTPAQAATVASNFCSPILASTPAWTASGSGGWTLTNAAAVATSNGQKIQFRWRLGGDVSGNGATYGGFGVDDVTVTGLRQFLCEPTRNPGAPCTFCSVNAEGAACDDGIPCTQTDTCQSGACVGSGPVTPTAVNNSLRVGKDEFSVSHVTWNDNPGSWDAYRGSLTPPALWSYNQTCLQAEPEASIASDPDIPPAGTLYYYLVTRKNSCGESSLGNAGNGSPRPNLSPCSAASPFYYKDTVDAGNDPMAAGCHMYSPSPLCGTLIFYSADRCLDGVNLYEWKQTNCHSPSGDNTTVNCRNVCPNSNGKCVTTANFCGAGNSSARCVCF